MNASQVTFDPALPIEVLWVVAILMTVLLGYAAWRGLRGWMLRLLAAMVLLLALANPSVRLEEKEPLADIAFLVVDQTSSQQLGSRASIRSEASQFIAVQLDGFGDTLDWREVLVPDHPDGSMVVSALAKAAQDVPSDRIAGALVLSDGVVADAAMLSTFPGPVHFLSTGERNEWDRRLVVEASPSYAIVGEKAHFTLRVEDGGSAPPVETVVVNASLDGGPVQEFEFPVNEPINLQLEITHAGQNLIELSTEASEGELTAVNNREIVSINGIRDRLRVLLVSGEPYPGERTWRNLLKSDASVDLVHFTILRPPDKHDGVPYNELSLIAFPTRELFLERIEEFDLIIFDRYARRGILPDIYLQNVADYARRGGALLIASGSAFASAQSLSRSALRDILPGEATGRVLREGYVPSITKTGSRHPVTMQLDGEADWGRWLQQIEIRATEGMTLMAGLDDRPLLQLSRVGEGRVALMASDQIWLWARGYEGGGPYNDLLRRLIHWLMQEPDLEEESLVVSESADGLQITMQTMAISPQPLTAEAPDGTTSAWEWQKNEDGSFETLVDAPAPGVWRLTSGELSRVVPVGGGRGFEHENPLATAKPLAPLMSAAGGGVVWLDADGIPDIRRVREGGPTHGRGWVGLVERDGFRLIDIRLTPLAPEWAWVLAFAALMLVAWRLEAR